MLKSLNRKDAFNVIQSYFFIVLGLFLYAFAWAAFIIPSNLTGGGIAGLATIIHYAIDMPIGVLNLILSAILIAIAFRVLGLKFIISTIISTVILSVFFDVLTPFFTKPLVSDVLTCTLIGGCLSAVGLGIIIASGGNSGGTDIIVLMISKYRNISYGKTSMFINVIIIAMLIFVKNDIENLLFSYINMLITTMMSDFVIDGFRQSYQIMVFSPQNETIASRISKEINRGVTLMRAYGWYSHKDQDVLITMIHRIEKHEIMRIIKQEDPNAFISVSKVQGVYGKNFDELKVSSNKKSVEKTK